MLTLVKAAVSLQAAQGEQPAARELVAELRAMANKDDLVVGWCRAESLEVRRLRAHRENG